MTRFARAKGSKASNARCPEEATSWSQMKRQMIETQKLKPEGIETAKFNPSRDYDSTKTEWADFETVHKKVKTNKMLRNVGESSPRKKKPVIKWQNLSKSSVESPNILDNEVSSGIKRSKNCKDLPDRKKEKKQLKDIKAKEKKIKQRKVSEEKKVGNNPLESNVGVNTKLRSKKRKSQLQENPVYVPPPKKKHITDDQQGKKMTRAEKVAAELPFKRKKNEQFTTIRIEGREVEICPFEGFPVMRDDWKRLTQLKKKMIGEGIPRNEIMAAMKLERRRAEKALARERKKVCFYCRESAHLLSDCPKVGGGPSLTSGVIAVGVCFKCGSTEHKQSECRVTRRDDFKFAKCFVCGEEGHISRQCPDNPRGLYPRGGGCHICGDVTHLKKDCMQEQQQKEKNTMKLETLDAGGALEALDAEESKMRLSSVPSPKKKRIKFM